MPAQVDAARPSRDHHAAYAWLANPELVVDDLDARLRIDVGPAGSPIHAREARIEKDAEGRERISDAGSEPVVVVPVGTTVALNNVTGCVTIGDTDGPLTLRLCDGCEVHAGRVASADVRIDGNSRVTIAEVDGGRLDVDVTGRGRVDAGGEVGRFASTVHGAGDVQLRGCADEAQLTVEGSGHICVTRVRRGLASICVGSGDIAVSFPPCPVSDRSAVIFDGLFASLAGR